MNLNTTTICKSQPIIYTLDRAWEKAKSIYMFFDLAATLTRRVLFHACDNFPNMFVAIET